jgi:segregation and condensation protein B
MTSVESTHLRLVEAAVFASAEPMSTRRIAELLPPDADVRGLLEHLRAHYRNRGVVLTQVGDAWAFRTAPDLGPLLKPERTVPRRLSQAAVETLAIIAYHQPVSRADIEGIRGVQLGSGVLDTLLEAGWVRPVGRREAPGRPILWGTTDRFLDHFGLAGLADLPSLDELRSTGLAENAPPPALGLAPADGSPSPAGPPRRLPLRG